MLQEALKEWIAALDEWRRRLDALNLPVPPRLPAVLLERLLSAARALDEADREEGDR